MYTELSDKELIDRRQYFYSKYCNEVDRKSKMIWFNLYKAYYDLIKELTKDYEVI